MDDLKVRVVRTDVSTTDWSLSADEKRSKRPPDNLVVQVAFMNMGNRPAIVSIAHLAVGGDERRKVLLELLQKGLYRGEFDLETKGLPMVLQPHDTKLVDLKLSSEDAWGANFCEEDATPNHFKKCDVVLLVNAVDSAGSLHSLAQKIASIYSRDPMRLDRDTGAQSTSPLLSIFR